MSGSSALIQDSFYCKWRTANLNWHRSKMELAGSRIWKVQGIDLASCLAPSRCQTVSMSPCHNDSLCLRATLLCVGSFPRQPLWSRWSDYHQQLQADILSPQQHCWKRDSLFPVVPPNVLELSLIGLASFTCASLNQWLDQRDAMLWLACLRSHDYPCSPS